MVVKVNAGIRNDVAGTAPETDNHLPSTSGGLVDDQHAPRYEDFVTLMRGGVAQAPSRKKGKAGKDVPPAAAPAKPQAPIDPNANAVLEAVEREEAEKKDLVDRARSLHELLQNKRGKVASPSKEDNVNELKKKIAELESNLEKVLREAKQKYNTTISFDDGEPVADKFYAPKAEPTAEERAAAKDKRIEDAMAGLRPEPPTDTPTPTPVEPAAPAEAAPPAAPAPTPAEPPAEAASPVAPAPAEQSPAAPPAAPAPAEAAPPAAPAPTPTEPPAEEAAPPVAPAPAEQPAAPAEAASPVAPAPAEQPTAPAEAAPPAAPAPTPAEPPAEEAAPPVAPAPTEQPAAPTEAAPPVAPTPTPTEPAAPEAPSTEPVAPVPAPEEAPAPTATELALEAALKQPDFGRGSQEILLNKEVLYTKRAGYMVQLTGHYNTQACTPEVRAEILEVFNWALTHADPEVFYAGFSAVTSLNDDIGLDLTRKYVFEYAKHRRAKDPIGTDNVDERFVSANKAAIRRAFVLEPVAGITQDDIVEAISRVLVKFNEPEKLGVEQLWISALVEVVGIDASKKDIVVAAITNRVLDNQKTDRKKKIEIMKWLVEIYRSAATDPEKQAVLAIFENVRFTVDKDAFYAGLSASSGLSSVNIEGLGEMTKYMATFAKHTSDKSDVSKDAEAVTAYKDAIGRYAEASALQHKGFSNDNVEAALLRLVAKAGMYNALTGGDLDIYRLLVGIEGLKDKPEIKDPVKNDAVETATKDGVEFERRKNLFSQLAALHNTDMTSVQRGVIAAVFDTAMASNKQDVYLAGLTGAMKLHDEGHAILAAYTLNMASRYAANDEIVKPSEVINPSAWFGGAIGMFSAVEPNRMRTLISGINEAWFTNPQQKLLWTSLMDVSEMQKQCYVDPSAKVEQGKPAPAKMSFRQAVRDAFITSFGALPDERKIVIAEISTTHTLDTDTSQSLPVELVDSLIEKGPRPVRMSVINALNHAPLLNKDMLRDKAEYEIEKAAEKEVGVAFSFTARIAPGMVGAQIGTTAEAAVSRVPEQTPDDIRSQDRLVRFYLALIEKRDVRTEAIVNGEVWHSLPALLIYGGYLTKADEPENYRDRAHAFFRDTRPVGGGTEEAPIAAYGIHRISLIEDKTAGAPKGEIANQCKRTLELLNAEWRRRNPRWTATVGFLPSDTSMFSGSKDPVMSTPGLDLRLGRATAANENDRRGYVGVYANPGAGKFAGGVEGGWVWDLNSRVSFSFISKLGYLQLWGEETNGRYDLALKGAELAIRPQLSVAPWRGKWHRAANLYFAPRLSGFYGDAVETRVDSLDVETPNKDENRFGYGAGVVFGGAFDFGK